MRWCATLRAQISIRVLALEPRCPPARPLRPPRFTTTQTTEDDTIDPVVVSKHTESTPGESEVTKHTVQTPTDTVTTKHIDVGATVTTTTKNTNLAPNFVRQPGGPFPPFAQQRCRGLAGVEAPLVERWRRGLRWRGARRGLGRVRFPANPPAGSAPVVSIGTSPVLAFVRTPNPAQEVDVTTPSTTTTDEEGHDDSECDRHRGGGRHQGQWSHGPRMRPTRRARRTPRTGGDDHGHECDHLTGDDESI